MAGDGPKAFSKRVPQLAEDEMVRQAFEAQTTSLVLDIKQKQPAPWPQLVWGTSSSESLATVPVIVPTRMAITSSQPSRSCTKT